MQASREVERSLLFVSQKLMQSLAFSHRLIWFHNVPHIARKLLSRSCSRADVSFCAIARVAPVQCALVWLNVLLGALTILVSIGKTPITLIDFL